MGGIEAVDFGLDLDFFNYRLGIVLDYYYRYTDKVLYEVTLPGNYSGYATQWRNAYALSNEGIELQVKWDIFRNDILRWNGHVQYSFQLESAGKEL